MNQQKQVKQNLARDGITLPLRVKEIFHSIQGEGPYSGIAATFIRLGGCNLQCTWCDTDYTTDVRDMLVKEILDNTQYSLVVITGGEPFAQNIKPLVEALLDKQHTVQVETNGTLSNPAFPWEEVTVVVSPKVSGLHKDVERNAKCYKYVVSADDVYSKDGLPCKPTQKHAGIPARPMRMPVYTYVMPRDDKDDVKNTANMLTAANSAKSFGYILSLQMHKILGVE